MVNGLAIGKNVLALYSSQNASGKKDATGAFIPEARAFAKLHEIPSANLRGINLVKAPMGIRRRQTMDAIAEAGGGRLLDAIALFCHGWPRGIQFGFNREHIPELAQHLARYCAPDVKIVLYACLAAENDVRDSSISSLGPATDGGFGDMLRDEMARVGLAFGWVDAHKTKGHTTWNPYLVRFLCEDVHDASAGAEGGAWLVAPRSELWAKWVKALGDKAACGMRYRFPFLREMEVKAELLGARYVVMESLDVQG